jgi:hypothetical protein
MNTRSRILIAAASVVVLLVVIAAFAFMPCRGVTAGSCDDHESSLPGSAAVASTLTADLRPTGRSGPFVRLRGNVLTVRDGEGEHEFLVTAETEVARGVGHQFVTDHDLGRILPTDSLTVVGLGSPGELPVAEAITVNGFIGRDGIVISRGEFYVDVRLRRDRLSSEYDETATRIWTNRSTSYGRPRTAGVPNSGDASADDVLPGRHAAFQGFTADDGEYVAILVWLSD